MKIHKKPNGTIRQFVNNQYFVELDNGTNIIISYDIMHRNVDLTALMIDGSIPSGTRMVFFIKDQDTAYPDAGTYPLKNQLSAQTTDDSIKKLLDGLLPYNLPTMSMNVFIQKIMTYINDINPLTIQEIFTIFYSDRSDEEKQQQISILLRIPEGLAEESNCFERKGYMLHTAGNNADYVDGKNMQLREIAEELVSFANDPTTDEGTVVIGVDDDGNPTGLEREIAQAYPNMDRDQFQATVITNVFSSYINDASFMQSLRFDWRQMEGHLLCLISTNYVGLPIIIGDGIMPYRSSNTKSIAKGNEMVKLIWNNAIKYMKTKQNEDVYKKDYQDENQ